MPPTAPQNPPHPIPVCTWGCRGHCPTCQAQHQRPAGTALPVATGR